jgi:hypothetical protein
MRFGGCLVALELDGHLRKICRVFFGADGSYYVTSPYHRLAKAVLMKATVNYTRDETFVSYEEAVDVASLDDDENALKLAHHPDGFVQFSGHGVVSGIDESGAIRGVGARSWPLFRPTRGPAFAMVITGFEGHPTATGNEPGLLTFRHSDFGAPSGWTVLNLEGHYFPPLWRRFVRVGGDGMPTISIVHPAKAVLRLKVVFSSADCAFPGFIGLEAYLQPNEGDSTPAFTLSGPTEKLRRNAAGEVLGDGIFAMYPRIDNPGRRSANYRLGEVPGSEPE